MTHVLTVIGKVCRAESGFEVRIDEAFRQGLTGLDQFSHAFVFWLADRADAPGNAPLICPAPYTACDQDVGVFASRSPDRPNPVCLSAIAVTGVDIKTGSVTTPYIDTLPETPIIDIKPYFPASDLVSSAHTPAHFSHWPMSYEESALFDWSAEFR
ncbi:TrmO family methyltransferase domain-containing protein [Roseibium sp.]|uniref:TrmO family methyltransferase domain-containing protein n=1 Tax=Roseibium sp. TaxID=1936156 RepID=UPI003B51985C